MSLPRTRELRAEPPMAELAELRRRIGASFSDEEFLLRATMPAGLVDAMRAAGPAARHYDPATRPVMELLSRLLARRDLAQIELQKPGFRLALRRVAPGERMKRAEVRRARTAISRNSPGFMFDVDGTLLLSDRSLGGYELLPGAAETLDALAARAVPFVLLTNGSAYPPAEQAAKLRKLGLPVADEQMITPSSVAAGAHDAQRRAGARWCWVRAGVGFALREAGIETRDRAASGRDGGRCGVRRLASGLRHEGHRGRLQCDLRGRETLRGLGRAVLRDAARPHASATPSPSPARSGASRARR